MTVRGGGIPRGPLAFMPNGRMGPPLRSFAADAHDCIMVRVLGPNRIQGCGATEPRPKAGSPLIVIATALACRLARNCQGIAWQGRSMPQGWGDSQPCTDSAHIDVSDAQVGTKKRALNSNQETDEGKLRRPGELLDKENPIQGPRCRFRREARARERHRHRIDG